MHHRKLTNETRAAAAASVQGSDLEWLVREIQQKENFKIISYIKNKKEGERCRTEKINKKVYGVYKNRG